MTEEKKQEIKKGAVRPIYRVAGFQVCKNPEKDEWVSTELEEVAELLSDKYKKE